MSVRRRKTSACIASATAPAAVSAFIFRLPLPSSLHPIGAMIGTIFASVNDFIRAALTSVGSP